MVIWILRIDKDIIELKVRENMLIVGIYLI